MWLSCVVGLSVGCQPTRQTETQSFELAEEAYRTGRYREAIDGYESFLERYPSSPLASTARVRIRSLTREVRSMLGRADTPRPIYRGKGADATLTEADSSTPLKR